ncbi:soluble lytic murein transglycosylase [Bacillus horti]|uniref:Soluble lytic murein transglycosylase n=2 Tax=Caldalkalibacillus horti TaxID=77523 RepID=A0ABT9VT40_9BACI|nr:soluble lytic murein transglycosylase [Bacillus horti]
MKQLGLLIALVALIVTLNSSFFWKLMYPIQYTQEVEEAATYYGVDPYLVLSVVQIESKFKQDIFSKKGAAGLMQLMPETAQWVNEESGLNKHPNSYIDDARSNILLGTWYISYLLQKYDNDHVKAIVAYNAGQGHVDRWLSEGVWDGTEHRLDQIPFGETRHYASRVLYYLARYQNIYENEFAGNQELIFHTRIDVQD